MRNLNELEFDLRGRCRRPEFSELLLAQAERRCELRFPQIYVDFLRHSNGGNPEVDSFDFVGGDNGTAIGPFYWLAQDEDIHDDIGSISHNTLILRKEIQRCKDGGLKMRVPVSADRLLAVGCNGGGNIIFMDTFADGFPIYIYYFDEDDISFVNPRFEGFIDSLYIG